MGRPKGATSKIAEELDVDPRTVRRALDAAGMGQEQAEADFGAAVEVVRVFVDNERVVGHHATRVTTNPGIRDARQRFEELKAQKLELEIAVTEGRLIDRQAVTDTGVRLLTEIREAFLRLGRRVADQAVGKDAREIARLVESEARTILEDLADEKRFFARLQEDALS